MDDRMKLLAKNLINYSVSLKKGEKILIEMYDDALPLAQAMVEEAYAVGAMPFVTIKRNRMQRTILMNITKEQVDLMAKWEAARMSEMDAYIGVRENPNNNELCDVPSGKQQLYSKYFFKPVHGNIRVPKTKWCVLRYPSGAMAQNAKMSTAGFEDFYYKVCNLDYDKMDKAMNPLVALMQKTDKVLIKGEGTELSFSIKDIPAVKCSGKMNIPDGEIYTAPVKHSVNGVITYNAPSPYDGFTYENVCLEFKNGKIVKATANNTEKINKVFATDDGACYVGEFAIGVNPYIKKPMGEILFDEKIMGSFHFTPGAAYQEADNSNRSAVHWDLVCIQTKEYGGGEIWFDDVLIRKDGVFVLPELEGLNPDNLV